MVLQGSYFRLFWGILGYFGAILGYSGVILGPCEPIKPPYLTACNYATQVLYLWPK